MRVLFQDQHLVCVQKPGGVPSQPDRTGDPAVVDLLTAEPRFRNAQLGLPHRLDRPVSGALLLTKDADTLAAMSALFASGGVEKRYWAIVEGRPPERGTWEHVLAQDGRSHKARVRASGEDGTRVALEFRRLAQGDRYALLELAPDRGFFHQLRAQCGAAGHPIKGDVKYGARRGEPDRTIALHARSLTFAHPASGEMLHLAAPPPDNKLWNTLLAQRGDAVG